MILSLPTLEAIRRGEVTVQVRRWTRPTVSAGGTLRTAVGILSIDAVEVVTLADLTPGDAHAAGFSTRSALVASLRGRRGRVHRVTLRWTGEDDRIARGDDTSATALDDVTTRLDAIDARGRRGPWTRSTLGLIGRNPGVRAAELADALGREKLAFKTDVRRLKELGLTESLEVGYRLSALGRAVIGT